MRQKWWSISASVESKSLSARPILIKNSNHLAKELAKIIDIDEDIIKNKLLSGKKFVWLKRNITPFEHQKIIDLGEINLEFHSEHKRIYPYKNNTSHLVGFVNIDHIGQKGIERSFDQKLSSSKDVTLSIDINLQQSIRHNLLETINYYKAESGLAIVMDISNGKFYHRSVIQILIQMIIVVLMKTI